MGEKLRALRKNTIKEGSEVGGDTGQLLNLDASSITGRLGKPVGWASVFPDHALF